MIALRMWWPRKCSSVPLMGNEEALLPLKEAPSQ